MSDLIKSKILEVSYRNKYLLSVITFQNIYYPETESIYHLDLFKGDTLESKFWSLEEALVFLEHLIKLNKDYEDYPDGYYVTDILNYDKFDDCLQKRNTGRFTIEGFSGTIYGYFLEYFDENSAKYKVELNMDQIKLIAKMSTP